MEVEDEKILLAYKLFYGTFVIFFLSKKRNAK